MVTSRLYVLRHHCRPILKPSKLSVSAGVSIGNILPIFGLIIGQYIFNKKHILTEEKYEEIMAELKVKRGEVNGENTV